MRPAAELAEEFDRLAGFETGSWNHNSHYHSRLLASLPPAIGDALDVGCGAGEFTCALAARCRRRAIGLDLAPRMIELARMRSKDVPNVEYRVQDVRALDTPDDSFDCIASVATLHHLPMRETLSTWRRWLRPGGTLLVLDLLRVVGAVETLLAIPGRLAAPALAAVHGAPVRLPAGAAAAWEAHGRHDVYPSLREVRETCREILPGAIVKRRLLWRYSLVWRKG